MKVKANAKIKRIEQAHTLNIFGTINLSLAEVARGILSRLSLKSMISKTERLKGYELVIKLRKPSAEHQFSYLYEQLAKRFGEMKDGRFTVKEEMNSKLKSINSPYSAATFVLNEFFLACDDLTSRGEAPFEGIDQRIVTQLPEKKKKEVVQEVIAVAEPEVVVKRVVEPEVVTEIKEEKKPVVLSPKMSQLSDLGIPGYSGGYQQEMLKHEKSLYGM